METAHVSYSRQVVECHLTVRVVLDIGSYCCEHSGPKSRKFRVSSLERIMVTERDSAAKMKATTVVVNSSHVVMISKPDSVANFILQAIATLNEC